MIDDLSNALSLSSSSCIVHGLTPVELSRSPDGEDVWSHGARLNDNSQRAFEKVCCYMYEGQDEVSAGEDQREHDDREHNEES